MRDCFTTYEENIGESYANGSVEGPLCELRKIAAANVRWWNCWLWWGPRRLSTVCIQKIQVWQWPNINTDETQSFPTTKKILAFWIKLVLAQTTDGVIIHHASRCNMSYDQKEISRPKKSSRMPISGCCSLSPWTGTMMCLVPRKNVLYNSWTHIMHRWNASTIWQPCIKLCPRLCCTMWPAILQSVLPWSCQSHGPRIGYKPFCGVSCETRNMCWHNMPVLWTSLGFMRLPCPHDIVGNIDTWGVT